VLNRITSRSVPVVSLGLLLLLSTGASAQCIRVVDAAAELPHVVQTPGGATIRYFYNLELESYLVIASRGDFTASANGPFHLSLACAPARLRWENDDFVLLEGACGTFCWYVDLIPVAPARAAQRVERPLAFDAESSLLAWYADKDLIRVRNVVTGIEQEIRTAYECESASGLCFEDMAFDGDRLLYTWRLNPDGVRLELALDSQLFEVPR